MSLERDGGGDGGGEEILPLIEASVSPCQGKATFLPSSAVKPSPSLSTGLYFHSPYGPASST